MIKSRDEQKSVTGLKKFDSDKHMHSDESGPGKGGVLLKGWNKKKE